MKKTLQYNHLRRKVKFTLTGKVWFGLVQLKLPILFIAQRLKRNIYQSKVCMHTLLAKTPVFVFN